MMLALDSIAPIESVVRRTRATAAEDASLTESIRALGVLQPVLVRPIEDGTFAVVAGRRRVMCARAAGLTEIPAEITLASGPAVIAAEAAENIVRAPMTETDRWRALVRLQDDGFSLIAAAQALGLSERRARQLDKLGRLHPSVLALVETLGVPEPREMAVLVQTDHKRQAAAAKGTHNSWWTVVRACEVRRIPITRAIFDTAHSKVQFEEDMFAQPDDPDRFATADIAGFLKAQTEALTRDVHDRKKKGERVSLADWSNDRMAVVLPAGWSIAALGPREKTLKKNDPRMRFVAVCTLGAEIGAVTEAIAIPAKKKAELKRAEAKKAREARKAAQPDAPEPAPEAEEPSAAGLTRAGLELVAEAKTQALRTHLREMAEVTSAETLLRLFVLLFAGDNIQVRPRENIPGELGGEGFRTLARRAMDRGEELRPLAGELLARCIVVNAPGRAGTGPAADWVGAVIHAERSLPRFDTEAFLAHVPGDLLRAIAAEAGIQAPRRVADLRAALVGHAEAWRPKEAAFTATPEEKPQ